MTLPAQPEPCDCILNDPGSPWEGHTQADHERERCSGRWTSEPPCGGCINCEMTRAYYYQRLAEQNRAEFTAEATDPERKIAAVTLEADGERGTLIGPADKVAELVRPEAVVAEGTISGYKGDSQTYQGGRL